MPRYCMLLSFQPACRLCCLEASSVQSTWASRLGAGVSWRGETNSVARLCGQGIDRCRQGGREQRTGERVRSGQQQRQLAGGFAARFGRRPIHMIIGGKAPAPPAAAGCSARWGLAWVTPRIAVGRRPNRSSRKQQSAWQTTSAFIRVPPPQQWVKKWANSTKIARLATGKSTLPTVK